MNTIDALDKMIALVVKPSGTNPVHNCLLYLNAEKSGFRYEGSSGNFAELDTSVSHTARFRIGSITKPFTAAIILQLMEEGALALNDRYTDRVSNDTKAQLANLLLHQGIDLTGSITIRQLLMHRSGLRDYFSADERFFEYVRKSPQQSWHWKLVMEKYFAYGLNQNAPFRPGESHHYADTNYLLLAVLIEEICHRPFHETVERRILQPLGLRQTHLEFYQEAKESLPVIFPFHGETSLEGINTSFDWGGGGLISTAHDLDVFIRALASGRLFQQASTLKEMLAFEGDDFSGRSSSTRYGLGLQQKTISGLKFIGHTSAYGAVLFYEPVNEISIVISLNQMAGMRKVEWLLRKVIGEYV